MSKFGEEFSGLDDASQADVDEDNACEQIEAGAYKDAIGVLAGLARRDPVRGASYRELAGCLHLLIDDDHRGAVVRLRFALGQDPPPDVMDAVAEAIACAPGLDSGWAALAWGSHSDGQHRLDAMVHAGQVDPLWIGGEGYDALEALVFDRADDGQDPYWVATSASLAAREDPRRFDDDQILAFADAVADRQPDNPRAAAIRIAVLCALGRDADAQAALRTAIATLDDRPARLLELLDALDPDAALEQQVRAAYEAVEDLPGVAPAMQRRAESPAAPRDPGVADAVRDVDRAVAEADRPFPRPSEADALPPTPPASTDETIRGGDQAFSRWLGGVGLLVALAAAAAWYLVG